MPLENTNKNYLLVVLGDLIIIPFSYFEAYLIRFSDAYRFWDMFPPVFLGFMILGYLTVFYLVDLYSWPKRYDLKNLLWQCMTAIGLASILALFLKYVLFLLPIGRGILLIANLTILLLIYAWRIAAVNLFKEFSRPRQVAIYGNLNEVQVLERELRSNPRDFRLAGFFGDDPSAGAQLGDMIEKGAVDLVVLARNLPEKSALTDVLLASQLRGVEIVDFADLYLQLKERIPISFIQDENWFLKTRGFSAARRPVVNNFKRVIDAAISFPLLVISLPFWPILAACIKADSRGPVFYRQRRVGKNEAPFTLVKFRSMVASAEDTEPVWAAENDRRVTRVGRFMRRLHLDELPQLWNILRGDMSLVGPRPERPEFVERLKQQIPYYALRHFVKPGMTGWAQVNYRYAASLEDSQIKLEYDLYYVAHTNFLFDFRIMLKTIQGLFSGEQKGRA